jgi:hypothetical protein
MWQNFTAVNFRCFRSILLKPLDRINLIAGKNNTGKTALLEAIHIHSHPENPKLLFDIHSRRGLRGLAEGPPHAVETARWLFYEGHAEAGLRLSSQCLQGGTRTLEIWSLDASTALQRFPKIAPFLNQFIFGGSSSSVLLSGSVSPGVAGANPPPSVWAQAPIIMRTQENGREAFAVWVLTQLGYAFSGKEVAWRGRSSYLSSAPLAAENDLDAFSEVESANRQEEVLASLRILEPRLRRLSLLLLDGKPVIHGDIGLSRLVPIPLMGEGMRRLLSIVLAIVTAPGGRVLIDEIENGLHYSVQKKVWQVIAQAARQADVQVFATTHSWECLRWAHEAFSESEVYDLRLFRLDRRDGNISVVSYDREGIESALLNAVEMR